MKRTVILLLLLAIVLLTAGCEKKSDTNLYMLDDNEWRLVRPIVTEDEKDFVISLTSGGTKLGFTTGDETPNFKVVFNEGTESEAEFLLIVDFEGEALVYIVPDLYNNGYTEMYLSFTSTLDFYDFIP